MKQEHLLASYPLQGWHEPPSLPLRQQEGVGIPPGMWGFSAPTGSAVSQGKAEWLPKTRPLVPDGGDWRMRTRSPQVSALKRPQGRQGGALGTPEELWYVLLPTMLSPPPNQLINLKLSGSSLISELCLRCSYTRILRHDHHLEARALNEARKIYSQRGPKRGLEILHEPTESHNES